MGHVSCKNTRGWVCGAGLSVCMVLTCVLCVVLTWLACGVVLIIDCLLQ